MIDLEKKHLNTLLRILALRIPECEVWAFGSRVRSAIQGQAHGRRITPPPAAGGGGKDLWSTDAVETATRCPPVGGSTGKGPAKKYSDLDLAVIADEKIDWKELEELKLAMSESDLPIMVDILDWNSISDSFKKIIEQKYEVLQRPDGKS